jgi:hypothetical protein
VPDSRNLQLSRFFFVQIHRNITAPDVLGLTKHDANRDIF